MVFSFFIVRSVTVKRIFGANSSIKYSYLHPHSYLFNILIAFLESTTLLRLIANPPPLCFVVWGFVWEMVLANVQVVMLGSVGYGKHGSKGSWVLWKAVKGVGCDEGECNEREREILGKTEQNILRKWRKK